MIAEFYVLKYFIFTEVATLERRSLEIQPILVLLLSPIIFLVAGLVIDKLKNKTKVYRINLLRSLRHFNEM